MRKDIKHLYHYTNFDSFVKIWLTGKFRLGTLDRQNDILESRKRFSVEGIDSDRLNLTKVILERFKQACFTMDYSEKKQGCMSTMMWGHYGDKGKGVCIEFDYKSIEQNLNECYFNVINYVDKFPLVPAIPKHITSEKDIRKYILKCQDEFFFTKSDDWKAENEFRIVSDKINEISVEKSITNVYVANCDSDTIKMIQELTKNNGENIFKLDFATGVNTLYPRVLNTL